MAYWTEDADAIEVMPAPAISTTTTRRHFQEGNPQMGRAATIVDADWLNMVQNEILNTVESVKLIPDKTDHTQLLQAIQIMVGLAKGAIEPWESTTDYSLPAIVWGTDNLLYIEKVPSGPGIDHVGPKNPVSTTGYWLSLPDVVFPQPYGAEGTLLGIEGNKPSWITGRFGTRLFSSQISGAWTVPAGVYSILLHLTGGGASGAFATGVLEASGGSAGGTAIKSIAVTPGQVIPFVIGAGAPGVAEGQNGINGGISSCLGITAEGGKGGYFGNVAGAEYRIGGFAAGGDLNLQGGHSGMGIDNSNVTNNLGNMCWGGAGGTSYWGVGGIGQYMLTTIPYTTALTLADFNGKNPGSGGAGTPGQGNSGLKFPDNPSVSGSGADGIIVIKY